MISHMKSTHPTPPSPHPTAHQQDTECLVVPGFVVDAGIREWMARAYEVGKEGAGSAVWFALK